MTGPGGGHATFPSLPETCMTATRAVPAAMFHAQAEDNLTSHYDVIHGNLQIQFSANSCKLNKP